MSILCVLHVVRCVFGFSQQYGFQQVSTRSELSPSTVSNHRTRLPKEEISEAADCQGSFSLDILATSVPDRTGGYCIMEHWRIVRAQHISPSPATHGGVR